MKAVNILLISLLIMGYVGTASAVPMTIGDGARATHDSVSVVGGLDGFGMGDIHYLNTDGSLNFTKKFLEGGYFAGPLEVILGELDIKSSVLTVSYTPPLVNSVPEPTTLSIFGIALLFIGFVNHKRNGRNR